MKLQLPFFYLFLLFTSHFLSAQNIIKLEEKLLDIERQNWCSVDERARFPGCETKKMSPKERQNCSDRRLLEYVYSNIKYPQKAQRKGIEGMVVITFMVDKKGRISQERIKLDRGEGTGEEALRVVKKMAKKFRWIPAIKDGEAVRMEFNFPINFTLTNNKVKTGKYELIGSDTLWVLPDENPQLQGISDTFIQENLQYRTGGLYHSELVTVKYDFILTKDGQIHSIEVNKGNYEKRKKVHDFHLKEANRVFSDLQSNWKPALKNGRPVTARATTTFTFLPTDVDLKEAHCHFWHGKKDYKKQDYGTAKEHFEAAHHINPKDIDALLALGLCEFQLGNTQQADAYWEKMKTLETEADVRTPSCFSKQERRLIAKADSLFLKKMKVHDEKVEGNPYQLFVANYSKKELPDAFFKISQADFQSLYGADFWTKDVVSESDIEIIPPGGITKEMKAWKPENYRLSNKSSILKCFATLTQHPDVVAHSKKYDFFGGSQSSVSATLFKDTFVPTDYNNRSIQELIVLEVFLQKVINVYLE